MIVAIYCRVSTTKQDNENQLSQLREFAAKQSWELFDSYVDQESGSTADRAEFQRMFADASKRKFDLVLFWALDRFSREGVVDTLNHFRVLESYGVGYKSYTEQFFDSCGIFKDAVVAIMATLAKQERIKRAERTKAGLAVARAKGKSLGRPRTIRVTSFDVARLRASGRSYRHVARELGVSVRTVQRLSVS